MKDNILRVNGKQSIRLFWLMLLLGSVVACLVWVIAEPDPQSIAALLTSLAALVASIVR
jgi:lipid-A-disaccharide synthase-like uncharacterized protein